jgi:hypothetical protein
MTSYGSDYTARNQQSGDIVADGGATLLSPFSEGETAIMAGPALLREIQAGVANGDFAVSPQDPTATITEENNLPYWTYTDVNSAGAITCAVVSDASTASGNVLRWSVAGGTTTGKSATLTRFMPIAGSRNRSFAYASEANFLSNATSSTVCRASIAISFVTSAYVATGSSATESVTFTDVALGLNYIQAPRWELLAPDSEWLAVTVPADAAYAKITLTVSTTGTVSAGTKTLDCAEVRVMTAGAGLILPDLNTPTIGAGAIWQDDGRINIAPVMSNTDGTYARIFLDTSLVLEAPIGVNVDDGTGLDGELTAGIVNATTRVSTSSINSTGNVNIGVSDTSTAGALVFKGGNGGSIRAFSAAAGNDSIGIYNTSGSAFGFLVAENFYPGGQGSAFITHDGNFDFNDSVDITGGLTTTGTIAATGNITSSATITAANNLSANGAGLFHDTPTGVTLASGSTVGRTALWTLNAGTQYNLQRWTSTSTAALKKNIIGTTIAPEQIYNLALVDFEYDREKFTELYPHINVEATGTQRGVIWEQVADVLPEAAVQGYGPGDPPTIDWEALYFAALVAIQDLNKRLADLESR